MSRCFGNSKVKRCLICHLKMFIDCSVNFNFKYVGSLAISSALCFLISKRREETTKKMNVTLKKKNEKLLLKWQTVNRNRHFCLCFILHFLPFSSILPSFFSSLFSDFVLLLLLLLLLHLHLLWLPVPLPGMNAKMRIQTSAAPHVSGIPNWETEGLFSFRILISEFFISLFSGGIADNHSSHPPPPPPLPPSPPPFTHINKNSINFQLEFDFKPISDGFFFFVIWKSNWGKPTAFSNSKSVKLIDIWRGNPYSIDAVQLEWIFSWNPKQFWKISEHKLLMFYWAGKWILVR